MSSRYDFAGKRIAVVGLGPNGEMAADAAFLAKMNAMVSVYDMRSEARVHSVMAYVRSFGLANHMTGSVPADELSDMDMIVLSHEYEAGATFLSVAKKKGVPIERPETLLLRSAPPVTVVAVMGDCGKSTVVSMLYPMISAACAAEGNQSCYAIDPDMPGGSIAHLKRLKSGDVVVMRLPGSMLPELRTLGWSPQIAVFASMPKTSGRSEPFDILDNQTYNNCIIGDDSVIDAVKDSAKKPKAKMLRTKPSLVPENWALKGRGDHDRRNAAIALQTARLFKVTDEAAEKALSAWRPLKGRLEPVKKVRGVDFYNDSASVSPAATIAGMEALSKEKDLIVVIGGADSGEDYKPLYAALPQHAHTLVVIPGSGTLKERQALRALDGLAVLSVPSVEEAVRTAMDHAKKGDKVLFSPAFPAVGIDASRLERGERFVRAVRGL